MATNFPASLDSFSNPTTSPGQYVWQDGSIRNMPSGDSSVVVAFVNPALIHSTQHSNANDAIEAIETKLGIDGSADVSSIDYKLNSLTTALPEQIRDTIGSCLVEGAGIDITVSDLGDTITIASTITQYTDEMSQDAIGGMVDSTLVYNDSSPSLIRAALTGDLSASAGSNSTTLATVNSNVGSFGSASAVSTFTVNAKGLITAAGSASIAISSAAVSDFTEAAQDAVGTILADSATIDFTYTDSTPEITGSVKASSITEAMQVLADNTTNDASVAAHGYMKKLPGTTTTFYRGDGAFAAPSITMTQTEVDFGATPVSEATFTVSHSGITSGSKIIAQVAWEAPTSKEIDEIEMDDLTIRCQPGTDQFFMFIKASDGSYLADKFKINYLPG